MSTDHEQLSESVLAALEELARNATPGPWEAGDVWVYTDPIYPDDRRLANVLGMKFEDEARQDAERERGLANAAHIAAADPSMVLALITEIRRLRAVFEKAHTPTDEREACGCTTRQIRYVDGEWSRELELVPCDAHRRTVQGEPSSAVVLAALSALMPDVDWSAKAMVDANPTWVADMRAALRAAGVVSVQGEPEWEERARRAEGAIADALGVVRSGSVPLGVSEGRHYDRLLAEARRVLSDAVQAPEGEEKP